MLDNSIFLYGSNMSNSNQHNQFPLPTLVFGGGAGAIKGSQHLRLSGSHAARESAVHAAAARRRARRQGRRQHRRAHRGLSCASLCVRGVVIAVAARCSPRACGRGPDRAAQRNDATVALAAIEDGVDVNAKSPDGTTALHWAVYNDNVALVERLHRRGRGRRAPRTSSARRRWPKRRRSATPRSSKRCSTPAPTSTRPGADGQTALMVVARSGNTAAAAALIARGADVNAREAWREQTALMWAAAQSQPAMVEAADRARRRGRRALRRQRVAAASHGRAAAHVPAVRRAHAAAVRGARRLPRVRARARRGRRRTSTWRIRKASRRCSSRSTTSTSTRRSYLIEAGANPNKWDWWGRTPLYSAVDVNTLPHGGRAGSALRRHDDEPRDHRAAARSRRDGRTCSSSSCRRTGTSATTAAATRCS